MHSGTATCSQGQCNPVHRSDWAARVQQVPAGSSSFLLIPTNSRSHRTAPKLPCLPQHAHHYSASARSASLARDIAAAALRRRNAHPRKRPEPPASRMGAAERCSWAEAKASRQPSVEHCAAGGSAIGEKRRESSGWAKSRRSRGDSVQRCGTGNRVDQSGGGGWSWTSCSHGGSEAGRRATDMPGDERRGGRPRATLDSLRWRRFAASGGAGRYRAAGTGWPIRGNSERRKGLRRMERAGSAFPGRNGERGSCPPGEANMRNGQPLCPALELSPTLQGGGSHFRLAAQCIALHTRPIAFRTFEQ